MIITYTNMIVKKKKDKVINQTKLKQVDFPSLFLIISTIL